MMRADCEAVLRGEMGKEEFLQQHSAEPQPRVKPVERSQSFWRPVVVEELVGAEHPVRAIWALLGELDLSSYYRRIRAVEGVAGRERTDPRVLLALWVYAYGEGVSSAREISRLCEYSPAYQWLCGLEAVNYHTLSTFRVEHKEELEQLFIDLLALLSSEGLISLESVMQDGTKIGAQAAGKSFRREQTLAEHVEAAQQRVAELSDEQQGEEVSSKMRAARNRALRERQERLKLAQQELEKVRALKQAAQKQEARVSLTDPEARVMKQANGGFAASYNLQLTTTEQEKIIVGMGVSQSGTDAAELTPAMERVAENLGAQPTQVVADGDYTNRANIIKMAALGVDFIGALGERKSQSAAKFAERGVASEFQGQAFSYDEQSDSYLCPNQKKLAYESKDKVEGAIYYYYRAAATDCAACPYKQQCCPQNEREGRKLMRKVEDDVVVAFREKMATEAAKQIYKRRSEVAEFPNLWLKEKMRLRKFRLRGLVKVTMEATWACLSYNIQQWIRLSWLPGLEASK